MSSDDRKELYISVDEFDKGIIPDTTILPFNVPEKFSNKNYGTENITPENFEKMLGKIKRGDANDAMRQQVFDQISSDWFDDEIDVSVAERILKFPPEIAEFFPVPYGKGTKFKKEDIGEYRDTSYNLFIYGPAVKPTFFMLARPYEQGNFLVVKYVATELDFENTVNKELGVWRIPSSKTAVMWDGNVNFTIYDVFESTHYIYGDERVKTYALPKSSEMIVKRLKQADKKLLWHVFGTITVPKNTLLYNASHDNNWQCNERPYSDRGSFFAGAPGIIDNWGDVTAQFITMFDVPDVLNLMQPPKGTFVETTPSIFDFKPYWTCTRWFLRQLIFGNYHKYSIRIHEPDADVAFFYKQQFGDERIRGWISQDAGHLADGGELMLASSRYVKLLWLKPNENTKECVNCEEMGKREKLAKQINLTRELFEDEIVQAKNIPFNEKFSESRDLLVKRVIDETLEFRDYTAVTITLSQHMLENLKRSLSKMKFLRLALEGLKRLEEKLEKIQAALINSIELFEKFPANAEVYNSKKKALGLEKQGIKKELLAQSTTDYKNISNWITETEKEVDYLQLRVDRFIKEVGEKKQEKKRTK